MGNLFDLVLPHWEPKYPIEETLRLAGMEFDEPLCDLPIRVPDNPNEDLMTLCKRT